MTLTKARSIPLVIGPQDGIVSVIYCQSLTEFLDRQLKDVVKEKLAEHGAGAADTVQAELDKAIAQAKELGVDPETSQKVKDLRAKLAAAGGAAAGELEADIYNHLLAFFSRYYDEGDFISKRRYKGDVYAIPYAGEEVTLYWANKDQYYIKSGEWHKDYRFKVAGNKTVHFMLVEATAETNNNKEPDDAKRRYILAADNPVEATNAELTLRFEFRVPTDADKQAVKESEATRIFGGNFDKPSGRTQGDEREQFCANAEKRALAAISTDWIALVTKVITEGPERTVTDIKPSRTLLGKRLDHFTARNTFDYFIHKDLGGFLKRELDFYIKNEVVRLDDLQSLSPDHLARMQGKVRAIRAVAGSVIDFLSSIEAFQRKMWLKSKLVLGTNWLVSIDRVPAQLRDAVVNNQQQWKEWEQLGLKSDGSTESLVAGPGWGTRQYIDANDKLVIDTRFFDQTFTSELLASEAVLGDAQTVDDAISGLLLHAENFQALRLLQRRYCKQIDSIYIDPPYNSDAGPIAYKNGFKDSSWLALIEDRVQASDVLMEDSGILVVTIDDVEVHNLRCLLENALPLYDLLGQVPIKNNPAGRTGTVGFSICHEYALFLGRSGLARVGRLEHNEAQLARYGERDEISHFEWTNFRKHGGQNTYRATRPRQFYPIYVRGSTIRIPAMTWDNAARQYTIEEQPGPDEEVILPIDDRGRERIWDFVVDTAKANIPHLLVKYFALEGYEDALNNLPAPTGELLASADPATKDTLITYSLDLELGPNLLNLDIFRDPWGYTINAQPAGEVEIRRHSVDLVETFNYLLGLKVGSYGPIERYIAEFEQAKHEYNLGRLKTKGRLRRDANGPYVFQRVEGELLDGTRVLVVWRKLTDDADKDAAVLEAWMDRHREDTRQRSEHRDYHLIYINGPVTLPQPTAEIRTVWPIEETFKDRMFADTEGASANG